MTTLTEDLVNKVNEGEPISNAELKILIAEYTHLEQLLKCFGDRYALVRQDVYRILDMFESWDFHRRSGIIDRSKG